MVGSLALPLARESLTWNSNLWLEGSKTRSCFFWYLNSPQMDSDLDLVPGYNPHLKLKKLLRNNFAKRGDSIQLRRCVSFNRLCWKIWSRMVSSPTGGARGLLSSESWGRCREMSCGSVSICYQIGCRPGSKVKQSVGSSFLAQKWFVYAFAKTSQCLHNCARCFSSTMWRPWPLLC